MDKQRDKQRDRQRDRVTAHSMLAQHHVATNKSNEKNKRTRHKVTLVSFAAFSPHEFVLFLAYPAFSFRVIPHWTGSLTETDCVMVFLHPT